MEIIGIQGRILVSIWVKKKERKEICILRKVLDYREDFLLYGIDEKPFVNILERRRVQNWNPVITEIIAPNTYPFRIGKVIKDLDCFADFLEITSPEKRILLN